MQASSLVPGEESAADREDELVRLGVDEVEVGVVDRQQVAGIRDDRLERVVDVVVVEQVQSRRVERLELGVAPREVGRPALELGDVLDRGDHAGHGAGGVAYRRGGRAHADAGAVPVLVGVDGLLHLAALDERAEAALVVAVLVRGDPRRRASDHVGVVEPEHAACRVVPGENAAVDAEGDRADGRGGEHRAVQLLRAPQRLEASHGVHGRGRLVRERPESLEPQAVRDQAVGRIVRPDEAGDGPALVAPRNHEPVAVPGLRPAPVPRGLVGRGREAQELESVVSREQVAALLLESRIEDGVEGGDRAVELEIGVREVDPGGGGRAVAVGLAVGELDRDELEAEGVACGVADGLEDRADGARAGELGRDGEQLLQRSPVACSELRVLRVLDRLRGMRCDGDQQLDLLAGRSPGRCRLVDRQDAEDVAVGRAEGDDQRVLGPPGVGIVVRGQLRDVGGAALRSTRARPRGSDRRRRAPTAGRAAAARNPSPPRRRGAPRAPQRHRARRRPRNRPTPADRG